MTIEDQRTDQEEKETIGFVVATTYKNWPIDDPPDPRNQPSHQRYHIVYPVKSDLERQVALRIFRTRYDFLKVRYTRGKETKSGRIYTTTSKTLQGIHIHRPGTIIEFLSNHDYRQFEAIGNLIHEHRRNNILQRIEYRDDIYPDVVLHLTDGRVYTGSMNERSREKLDAMQGLPILKIDPDPYDPNHASLTSGNISIPVYLDHPPIDIDEDKDA